MKRDIAIFPVYADGSTGDALDEFSAYGYGKDHIIGTHIMAADKLAREMDGVVRLEITIEL